MTLLLGIDASTTATKAVLVDEAGRVAAAEAVEYGYDIPQPGWTEQDPSLWGKGALEAIRRALGAAGASGSAVAAIGLTGQMHGAVLLDTDRRVVRPAILWNDQRTSAECDEIRARLGGRERLVALTGNDAVTGLTAPKLLWVRRHEPEAFGRTRHVILPKDFVRLALTDELAVDKADGSGTLLFDLGARDWSPDVLAALELDPALFPRTVEGPVATGRITARTAVETGLAAGTPVVAGGGDQAAGAVGAGILEPGTLFASLGTSGVVFAATDTPLSDPLGRVHAFCHAVPGRWHLMSVMLSAAGSLRWFRDNLAPGVEFRALVEDAGAVEASTDGLFFLPYLTGERSPYPDPLARGAFVGLTVGHDRRHLTRAVLEGVAFGLADGLRLMREAGLPAATEIRVTGGGSVSPTWRQILADVLDAPIATVNTSEGAAYGAALLGAVEAGWFRSVPEAAAAFIRPTITNAPSGRVGAYATAHERYRALYPALAPTFHGA
ncbi:MAG TPA: xylulokinase [Candidatus Limnocylindrales bacterium]|nr:xylulokinase [Candidatus Limnocylindrales bacterium]